MLRSNFPEVNKIDAHLSSIEEMLKKIAILKDKGLQSRLQKDLEECQKTLVDFKVQNQHDSVLPQLIVDAILRIPMLVHKCDDAIKADGKFLGSTSTITISISPKKDAKAEPAISLLSQDLGGVEHPRYERSNTANLIELGLAADRETKATKEAVAKMVEQFFVKEKALPRNPELEKEVERQANLIMNDKKAYLEMTTLPQPQLKSVILEIYNDMFDSVKYKAGFQFSNKDTSGALPNKGAEPSLASMLQKSSMNLL